MALTIGIIGLPQSGKTTLFNALTKAGAPISGYATSTVQANLAVVQVPDARLQPLADIFKPKKVTPTTVEFVDVAGMGQAAQAHKEKREGLSAEFLGHIRNADALAIVLRTFANSNVPHIYGDIDPNRDLDSLYAELALTDLATVERRIERTKKAAKSGEKKYIQELEVLHLLQEALNELRMIDQVELLAQDHAVLDELFLLTLKPRMFVLNVSEDVLGAANDVLERIAGGEDVDIDSLEGELKGIAIVANRAKAEGAEVVAVSARLEAEQRIVFRYCDPAGRLDPEWNFNGSLEAIAGVLNEGRNVLGMMPHPERMAEAILGGTDGIAVLGSLLDHLECLPSKGGNCWGVAREAAASSFVIIGWLLSRACAAEPRPTGPLVPSSIQSDTKEARSSFARSA